MQYKLYYWPGIPGRAEFVRLAFEASGRPYVDVARRPAQVFRAMAKFLDGGPRGPDRPPFAPPFLEAGRLLIGQTAAILFYLGPRLGLAPKDEVGRLWLHQLQLTIADWLAEVHDTHHPIAVSLYYEHQKREARRRARHFRDERLPKFLRYFERVLGGTSTGYVLGRSLSYVDLSLFQMLAGLRYAFPRAMSRLEPDVPRLRALHDRVATQPRIAAYLASRRRLAFNQQGIFRHYPELDG